MGSSEEYLDSLLKAAIDNDENLEDEGHIENQSQSEVENESNQTEELDLESLLSQSKEMDDTDYSADVAELLGTLGNEDEELAEISELLNQSQEGTTVDDDMLALLESLSEEGGSEYTEQLKTEEPDEIDIFAMEQDAGVGEMLSDNGEWNTEQAVDENEIDALLREKSEPVKEKKKWFKIGKKKKEKKKGKEKEKEEENNNIESTLSSEESSEKDILGEELFGMEELEAFAGIEGLEAIADSGNKEQPEQNQKKTQKKEGFFSKFMDFLLEEEEEEEEPPKKEKVKKSKKGAKKQKENAVDENGALLEELEAEDKKDKKKKVKTKSKKKKEKKEKPVEVIRDEGKKLPKKIVIGIFAVCFSIMVLFIIVAMLLPGVMSLKEARKAYYSRDYKTAYENLTGKDLNSSDSLMLEKATTLMTLQRQYESFANYHKMGKELEALNALVKGCNVYISLKDKAIEQNVIAEFDETYTYILDSLEYLYGVSEEQALLLYCIEDDATYTEELQKIVDNNQAVTGGSIPAYQVGEEDAVSEE